MASRLGHAHFSRNLYKIRPQKKIKIMKSAIFRKLRMAQSRRQVRPRSSRLVHSASFRARNPNKASMTLMLAAASICATDVLERQLVPPGFECRERDLLGRSWRRDWGMCKIPRFLLPIGDPIADREKLSPIGCSGSWTGGTRGLKVPVRPLFAIPRIPGAPGDLQGTPSSPIVRTECARTID